MLKQRTISNDEIKILALVLVNECYFKNWTVRIGRDQSRLLLDVQWVEKQPADDEWFAGWMIKVDSPSMLEAKTGKRSNRSSKRRHDMQPRPNRPVFRGRILVVRWSVGSHDCATEREPGGDRVAGQTGSLPSLKQHQQSFSKQYKPNLQLL